MSQMDGEGEDRSGTFRPLGADKAAFVERLRMILANWPSADRLAREMKVSPSAFRKWLKGEAEPSRERLVALAHAAGVGVAWLAEGAGAEPVFAPVNGGARRPRSESDAPPDLGGFVLPRKTQRQPAGGGPIELDGAATIALRHDWVRSAFNVEPENLVVESATDEAMQPTIRQGSTLLINVADRSIRALGIYVLDVNGDRLVRRVQPKHDGGLVLMGDHPAWQPDMLSPNEAATVAVIGRVVWSGGML